MTDPGGSHLSHLAGRTVVVTGAAGGFGPGQPWGVLISDITVRASNDDYLM